nr:MAG TPA: hypothetical protein [Bacteriophage sp.]
MTLPPEVCWLFLSTPSARRVTASPKSWPRLQRFLSTPSARRVTPGPESC